VPELPEVEREARLLAAASQGARIVDVVVPDPRVLRGVDVAGFVAALRGRVVQRVTREGKHLFVALAEGASRRASRRGEAPHETLLWTHLRMTGRFVFGSREAPLPPHTRFALVLAARVIAFVDVRRFGTASAGESDAVRALAGVAALGPDALRHGGRTATLRRVLAAQKRPIKAALLDQGVLAGLGNIHATEALFRAGVHPETPAGALDDDALRRLARGIAASLRFAMREVSRPDFAYLGDGGVNRFLVYGRDGEPCPRCAFTLATLAQSGRATVFCARCQPAGA
jgi:formamidopyrimidine-DNA glycosylase